MTTLRTRSWLAPLLTLALVAAACGGSDEPADTEAPTPTTTAPTATEAPDDTMAPDTTAAPTTTQAEPATETTTEPPGPMLVLDTTGWPELTGGALYEGWLIVDDTPISTGVFNVVDGAPVDADGETVGHFPVDDTASTATTVVITIEPPGDEDPAPADTHFLAGDLVDGGAELTIDHPAALGTDFAEASGEFVLATPTDGDRTNNEFSGVWFLTFPGPVPGLSLPNLPAGWTYEGWTVIEGIPVTTGTFLAVDQSDDAAPFSGTVRTPSFPGEDYLVDAPDGLSFPTDLSGSSVVVSVEPLTEDNSLPFVLKPLAGPVPADAELEPVAYPITTEGFAPPSGTATISA